MSACAHMALFTTAVGNSSAAIPARIGTVADSRYFRPTTRKTYQASVKSKTRETTLMASSCTIEGASSEKTVSR